MELHPLIIARWRNLPHTFIFRSAQGPLTTIIQTWVNTKLDAPGMVNGLHVVDGCRFEHLSMANF